MSLNLIFNFGLLIIFKYYDFINSTIFELLSFLSIRWVLPDLDLLLPVGISFYTFQAIGYTFDVYREKVKVQPSFGKYALFVAFFPQLVAGPIERASHLLPQFDKRIYWNYSNLVLGLNKVLWGLFMKVVVADRLGMYVDAVYGNLGQHNGWTLWLASTLFAIQIYGDFAGYSLVAIGVARILGFDLMENFRRPYFATSIAEFWSRWHISLSTWFRDYLYIPLGGNRVRLSRHLLNLMITFLISGLWHGANTTFIVWGFLHGFYLIIEVLTKKFISSGNPKKYRKIWLWIITQLCVIVAWVFFRAATLQDAWYVLTKMFSFSNWHIFLDKTNLGYAFIGIIVLMIKEIWEEKNYPRLLNFNSPIYQGVKYAFLFYIIVLLGVVDSGQFIYFQF